MKKIFAKIGTIKGQLISKADWRGIDSPKKQTDEFVLFALLLFTANKSNSSVHFLGESMARQSAFRIHLPFRTYFEFVTSLKNLTMCLWVLWLCRRFAKVLVLSPYTQLKVV